MNLARTLSLAALSWISLAPALARADLGSGVEPVDGASDADVAPDDHVPVLEVEIAGAYRALGLGAFSSVGVVLDRQAVLTLGLDLSYRQEAGVAEQSALRLFVPLDVRVYLAAPARGSLTGFLQPGVAYHQQLSVVDGADLTRHGVHGHVGVGAIYLFTAELALIGAIAPGVGYFRAEDALPREQITFDIEGWLGLLFRIG